GTPTDIIEQEETSAPVPVSFVFEQNYPNPFNPETKIVFHIPQEAGRQFVTVKIYDLLGRLVRVLFAAEVLPGRYEVTWDGMDNLQRPMPSGVYIYRLEAGAVTLSRSMVLLR
ncbi:MAG: FlgD immunoglobulin-like domain containing protein, partial [bacterium]